LFQKKRRPSSWAAQNEQPYLPPPESDDRNVWSSPPPEEQAEQDTLPAITADPPAEKVPLLEKLRELMPAKAKDSDSSTERAPPQKRSTLSWVANALVILVFATIVGGTVLFIFANNADMSIFGYRLFHVISDSMAPTPQADGTVLPGAFRENDAIIVRVADAQQIEVGDIITICREVDGNPPLTHRVTYVFSNFADETGIGFLTRGDSNTYSDPQVGGSRLIGVKVARIPGIGHLFSFVQNNTALTIGICVLIIAGVFVLFLLSLRKSASEPKGPKDPPPSSGDDPFTQEDDPWVITNGDWTKHPAFAQHVTK